MRPRSGARVRHGGVMPSVEQIARQIVAREGGYVNDPDDPGGATNFGVTIGTMQSLG
ncbi:glycosyl hydrolase 108 family protein, partial [Acinetobacter baumannii]|uniref:glycosyl hydrolase 108 family protein n=1 Tax=Acinetobacter baumannii TaxID=470 RepID=UPI003CC75A74